MAHFDIPIIADHIHIASSELHTLLCSCKYHCLVKVESLIRHDGWACRGDCSGIDVQALQHTHRIIMAVYCQQSQAVAYLLMVTNGMHLTRWCWPSDSLLASFPSSSKGRRESLCYPLFVRVFSCHEIPWLLDISVQHSCYDDIDVLTSLFIVWNIDYLWPPAPWIRSDDFQTTPESVCEYVYVGKDIFLLLPTGFGRSLCYEVPPFVFDVMQCSLTLHSLTDRNGFCKHMSFCKDAYCRCVLFAVVTVNVLQKSRITSEVWHQTLYCIQLKLALSASWRIGYVVGNLSSINYVANSINPSGPNCHRLLGLDYKCRLLSGVDWNSCQ